MGFLVGACVTLGLAVIGAIAAVTRDIGYWRARRQGVQLSAEVRSNDATSTGRTGTYYLTPVVRYHLNGRWYEAKLVNPSGQPADPGGSMVVVVHPEHPYEPYDRYQGMGTAARNAMLALPVGILLVIWALAVR